MRNLYTRITGQEDEGIYHVGQDIMDTFGNGNFTDGVRSLDEIGVSTTEFKDFVEAEAREIGVEVSELWYGHFDTDFWIALARNHY